MSILISFLEFSFYLSPYFFLICILKILLNRGYIYIGVLIPHLLLIVLSKQVGMVFPYYILVDMFMHVNIIEDYILRIPRRTATIGKEERINPIITFFVLFFSLTNLYM